MKNVIGPIILDMSSRRALARSVLNKIIEVYITMRNRTSRLGESMTPEMAITRKMTEEEQQLYRERYRARRRKTRIRNDRSSGIGLTGSSVIMAWRLINTLWIGRASALLAMTSRPSTNQRQLLSRRSGGIRADAFFLIFLGILNRIQKDLDIETHQAYCHKRYHYEEMCKKERQQQETSEEIITVDDLIEMVEEAVTTSTGFIRDFCLKQVERLVQILRNSINIQEL